MSQVGFNAQREEIYKNNYNKKSVIVVGGGPSGILSIRYLSQEDSVNVISFESKDNLGGMWYLDKYDQLSEDLDKSKHAFVRDFGTVQSSLYESLDLNNPKGLSLYKGFPIPKQYKEYMTQEQQIEYLHSYADHWKVREYTSFNTYVNYVRLISNMTPAEKAEIPIELTKKFLVQVVSTIDYEKEIRYFQADYVLAASGHFAKPNVYPIPNQELFEGKIMHSHHFRAADEKRFANKNVVIISSMISAQDIYSILLFKTAQPPAKITVIGRSSVEYLQKATSLQAAQQSGKIEFIQGEYEKIIGKKTIELKSGQIVDDVDVILLATGYQYYFPYLDKFASVDNILEYYEKSRSFGPLYNKIVLINEPNLMFPGCCNGVNQSTYERQVIYIAQLISGKFELPSKEEMMKDFEEDVQRCGSKKVYLAVARFPRFTPNNEYYPRKLLKDLKDIEFDSEYQDIWVKSAKVAETHMGDGNYYAMKQEDLSYIFPSDYAPKIGQF